MCGKWTILSAFLMVPALGCVGPDKAGGWHSEATDTGEEGSEEPDAAAPRDVCDPPEVVDDPLPCTPEDWGDLAGRDDTVYVCPKGADVVPGTMEEPFQGLQEALDYAAEIGYTTVALAHGSYEDSIRVTYKHSGIELVGACRTGVVVVAPPIASRSHIFQFEILGDSETSFNVGSMTIEGPDRAGLLVGGGKVGLRDMDLRNQITMGIYAIKIAAPVDLNLTEISVENTFGTEDIQCGIAYALAIAENALATAEQLDIVIGDNASAIYVDGEDASLAIQGCNIGSADERDRESGYGFGAIANRAGSLSMSDCVLDGIPFAGFAGFGDPTEDEGGITLSLADTTIRNVYPSAGLRPVDCPDASPFMDAESGAFDDSTYGIYTYGIESLSVDNVTIEDLQGVGVELLDTPAILQGLTISSIHSEDASLGVGGLVVAEGSDVDATDLTVSDVELLSVFASGVGTQLILRNPTITGNRGRSATDEAGEGLAWALAVVDGASIQADGAILMDNEYIAAYAGADIGELNPGQLTMCNCLVQGTVSNARGSGGHGAKVMDGASLAMDGCTIDDNEAVALVAFGVNTSLSVSDSVISNTRANPSGSQGAGVLAGLCNTGSEDCDLDVAEGPGPNVTMDGVTLTGNRAWGILAQGDGTALDLQDTSVENTMANGDSTATYAVFLNSGALLTGKGIHISDTVDIGLAVSDSDVTVGALDVRDIAGRGTYLYSAGVVMVQNSMFSADDLTVTEIGGPSLFVGPETDVVISQAHFEGNQIAGAILDGGSLQLSEATITDCGNYGIFVENLDAPISFLDLEDVTITAHAYGAVFMRDVANVQMTGCDLEGGPGAGGTASDANNGNAIYINGTEGNPEGAMLCVSGTTFRDSAEAVLFNAVSAPIDDCGTPVWENTFVGNTLDLVEQRCGADGAVILIDPLDGLEAEICPTYASGVHDDEYTLYFEDLIPDAVADDGISGVP